VFAESRSDLQLSAVAWVGFGWLAVGGIKLSTTIIDRPITLFSHDGKHWQETIDPPGLGQGLVTDVIRSPQGVLVTIDDFNEGTDQIVPTVFRTEDGVTFAPVGPRGPDLSQIVAVPTGYLGWTQGESPTIWASKDAVDWVQLDSARGGSLSVHGDTVVAGFDDFASHPPLFIGTIHR
jgi:hypothetical protein